MHESGVSGCGARARDEDGRRCYKRGLKGEGERNPPPLARGVPSSFDQKGHPPLLTRGVTSSSFDQGGTSNEVPSVKEFAGGEDARETGSITDALAA
jgi:hypothetical protein